MHVMTSRWLSRAVNVKTSGEMYSTRKKSRVCPTWTVWGTFPEKPPIFFTPNRDEIVSRILKVTLMMGMGWDMIMRHASKGVIALGRMTDWVSKKSSSLVFAKV